HAVLVAGADYRDVLADVVLALDDLLGGLRNILAVGQREVVNNLLLDGDLRAPGGVGFGVQALWIDFDFADPQQLLHTIAHGGIDLRFADFDTSEQRRLGDGAAQVEVGIAGEARDGGLHLQVGCGENVDIQLDPIQRRGGRRNDHRLRTAGDVGRKIETGRDR